MGGWLWRALASLASVILAFVLAPAVALFNRGGWPSWAWAFRTSDNPPEGDSGYQQSHQFFPGYLDGWRGWANRVGWLWRNPAYGFNDWLGVDTCHDDESQSEGDPLTSNIPGHSGLYIRRLFRRGSLVAWQWYYVRRWGQTAYCLRINLGWKLWGKLGDRAPFVASFNPLMGFEP